MEKDSMKDSFLKSVKNHRLEIKYDTGIYRHIILSDGTFNMMYEIITYPRGLVFTGDMGTYVFERTNDMFMFFRTGKQPDGKININPVYWSEKCKSKCVTDGIEKFSPELFREAVKEYVINYFNDADDENEKNEILEEVEIQILSKDDSTFELVAALNNFNSGGSEFEFCDFWENPCTEYTCRFLWCLYAIVYAIKKYDDIRAV